MILNKKMEDLIALSMQIMRSKMQLSSHGQLLKIYA